MTENKSKSGHERKFEESLSIRKVADTTRRCHGELNYESDRNVDIRDIATVATRGGRAPRRLKLAGGREAEITLAI
jgi:hypothetical protein